MKVNLKFKKEWGAFGSVSPPWVNIEIEGTQEVVEQLIQSIRDAIRILNRIKGSDMDLMEQS